MYKTFRLAGLVLVLALEQFRVGQIRRSWVYRRLIRPIRRRGQPDIWEGQKPETTLDRRMVRPAAHQPLETSPSDPPERKRLIEQVRQVDEWYHTIELPHNVVTPGFFDHRPALDLYHLPDDLSGADVLDVATFDGFWAFEMERRGAASATAIDIERASQLDLPPREREAILASGHDREMGVGFRIAHAALSSNVERRAMSVYDLSPERIGCKFDFVFCGDLLIHLRDPNLALQNIYSVAKDQAIIAEPFDPDLLWQALGYRGGYDDCWWWLPSVTAWEQMISDAGFSRVERVSTFRLDLPDGSEGPWRAVYKAYV